ncbi:hypothetical protein GGR54DRAFT_387613 [Hypoxylon sp. NC1633]|nr:hypothetical protein GGR54DRAFT_387613 [Hypoxylon sp. NC1633]
MSGSQSSRQAQYHEVVLRQKYNDPMKLKNSLDRRFGAGMYRVKTKANRYILLLPYLLHEVNRPSIPSMLLLLC